MSNFGGGLTMKKIFILTILFVLVASIKVFSQALQVTSFKQTSDLTASRFEKTDINGEPCGMIKVGLPLADAKFVGNVIESTYKDGEWWVYMTKGSKRITIKTIKYPALSYDFPEPIQSKVTYAMTVVNNDIFNKINAFSYIVPGLGQIELGNKTEGYAIIAGETLLLGGGVISSIAAKKQLNIMRDVDVSLEDFMTAKRKYNTQKAINVTCYVVAAALYGFHLYRVYYLSKKARTKGFTSLAPTIMATDESMALGLSININF